MTKMTPLDPITRLSLQLSMLQTRCGMLYDGNGAPCQETVFQEVKRYRSALERISEADPTGPAWLAIQKAMAALKEHKPRHRRPIKGRKK